MDYKHEEYKRNPRVYLRVKTATRQLANVEDVMRHLSKEVKILKKSLEAVALYSHPRKDDEENLGKHDLENK